MKRIKVIIIILFISTILFFIKNKKVIFGENIRNEEVINFLSEERINISELEIPDYVKILGLGEHTHGSQIDQKIKIEIYKKAVQNGFFTILAETDYVSVKKVDDYIKSKGSEKAKDVVSSLFCPSYRSEDFIEFINFLREYNSHNNNIITFMGYDVQYYDLHLKYYLNEISDIDKEVKERIILLNAKKDYKELLNQLEVLLKNENNKESIYLLRNIINGIKYTKIKDEDESFYLREKYTYENIKELSKDRKVFLIAHNGHIIKNNFMYGEIPSMGKLLSEEFGKRYYAILPFAYEDNLKIRKIVNNYIWYYVNLKVINNDNILLFNHNLLSNNISLYDLNKINNDSIFSKKLGYFCIGDGYQYENQLKYFLYKGNIKNGTDILIIINKEKNIKNIFPYNPKY